MIGDGATSDVQALPNDIAQVRSDEVGLSRFSQLVDRRPRDARQTSQEDRRGRELAPEAPDGVAHMGGTARVEVAQAYESDAADLKAKQVLGCERVRGLYPHSYTVFGYKLSQHHGCTFVERALTCDTQNRRFHPKPRCKFVF